MIEKINDLFNDKLYNWVHEDEENVAQIHKRAMIVATSPIWISGIFGTLLILVLSILGL
jgi:hypothetical protein